jgi:hypothetical protein
VTLAGLASVLALLGYDVDCACYSAYLSERDYQEFEGMFRAFKVEGKISYGTFSQLAENVLNSGGSVRELTCGFMTNGSDKHAGTFATAAAAAAASATPVTAATAAKNNTSNTASGAQQLQQQQQHKSHRVLLIDEVDVFFKADFYGNRYTPLATLQSDAFTALATLAWRHHTTTKGGRGMLMQVHRSPAYAELLKLYAPNQDIIAERVKRMVADVRNVDEHDYLVADGRIGCAFARTDATCGLGCANDNSVTASK